MLLCYYHQEICHWNMACCCTCSPCCEPTQDCSKGIRKSKGENFRRRPRSSAEGQGLRDGVQWAELMDGPWPRDWDCWSSRSLEKPKPFQLLFLDFWKCAVSTTTPKTYFNLKNSECTLFLIPTSSDDATTGCLKLHPEKPTWTIRNGVLNAFIPHIRKHLIWSLAVHLISNPAPMHTCLRYVRTQIHV